MFTSKSFPGKQLITNYLFQFTTGKNITSSTHSFTNKKSLTNAKTKIIKSVLNSEIGAFITENQLHLLTPFFRSNKHYKIFYKFVINHNVASDIVNKILPHIEMTKDIVVEANPGLGFITLCLLNSNVKKITLLDKSELVNISVNRLLDSYAEHLRLEIVNLFKCPGSKITDLIEESVKSKSKTKVIGIINNNTFLINLMYTYVFNELWNKMDYLEFYLVVGSTVQNTIITCQKRDSRYFYHSLFSFMFLFEELGSYSSDSFIPVSNNDMRNLTLMKITANSTLIKSVDEEDLKSYVFFLEVLSRNKKTFIIPTLEKYVPNCGLYLISKGVSMSNTIRDFSPADSVVLFNIFKKCEGYNYFRLMNFKFSGEPLMDASEAASNTKEFSVSE